MARPRQRGFSIVELTVVVGVITLLLALLLPALGSVRIRAAKTREANGLRQVGVAWTVYANQSNDKVLPGFLEDETQRSWSVHYRYEDGTIVPPATPSVVGGDASPAPPNVAGPWPWRLMPFLGYDQELLLGHRPDLEPDGLDRDELVWEIRTAPAFAYNGLMIGGWWADARRPWYDSGRVTDADAGPDPRVSIVSRSLGAIRRSAEVLIFTTAGERGPGLWKYEAARDDYDGVHIVVPPRLMGFRIWGAADVHHVEQPSHGAPAFGEVTAGSVNDVGEVLHVYGVDEFPGSPTEFG